jgi:hypothetical protein
LAKQHSSNQSRIGGLSIKALQLQSATIEMESNPQGAT